MGVLLLRPDASWTKVGYLDSANPTLSGVSTACNVGNDKSGAYKGIIEWDLRGLKWLSGSLVAAQLELNQNSIVGSGTGTDRVRRCRRHTGSATPFVEGATNECCWNNYSNGNAWAAAGATDTTNDVDTTDSFSWTAPTSGGYVTACAFSNTALKNLISDAFTNRGGYLCLLFELASRSGNLQVNYNNGRGAPPADVTLTPKLTLVFDQAQGAQLWKPGGLVVV